MAAPRPAEGPAVQGVAGRPVWMIAVGAGSIGLLALLNLGCFLRVVSEIGAYESYVPSLWPLLPASAVTEMIAVTAFAGNLLFTFRHPPAHLAGADQAAQHVTSRVIRVTVTKTAQT